MADAYIVEARRSAGGRRNGRLAGWHSADLAGAVLTDLVERTGIDPAAVEDVIMGCVGQGGEQALHIGRTPCSHRSCPSAFAPCRSTASTDRRSRRSSSRRRR